jgi:lipoprotein-anchoring transpeptidase ErfK/SrfK
MRLFDLLKPSLLVLPVALLLAAPAVAEPSSTPPSAETGSEAKANTAPNSATEQAESDPAAAQPEDKSPAAEANAEAAATPPGSQILINIDKSRQEMTVFVDGIEKYTWPVSTGKRGYSTPSGDYAPTSMNKIWYSKEWDNAPMPHAIFYMKDGHAIHGSLEVKNLGKPASHGCVRLSPTNAGVLFELVKANGMENTKVVLAGVTPGGEAKIAKQPAQPQYPRYGEADGGWFGPGPGYAPPQRRERRGLFGRRWFDPYAGPQGYYRAPRGYSRGY